MLTAGNYGPPPGFNWEWGSQDEPIKDGYGFEENNVQARVEDFVAACMDSFNHTRGNDIMLTMGTDFTYANAFVWCACVMRSCILANVKPVRSMARAPQALEFRGGMACSSIQHMQDLLPC